MSPLLASVVLDLVVAFAALGLLTHLLHDTSPRDTLTFVLVPTLLVVVGAIASLLAARRAVRVDPNAALRAR